MEHILQDGPTHWNQRAETRSGTCPAGLSDPPEPNTSRNLACRLHTAKGEDLRPPVTETWPADYTPLWEKIFGPKQQKPGLLTHR